MVEVFRTLNRLSPSTTTSGKTLDRTGTPFVTKTIELHLLAVWVNTTFVFTNNVGNSLGKTIP